MRCKYPGVKQNIYSLADIEMYFKLRQIALGFPVRREEGQAGGAKEQSGAGHEEKKGLTGLRKVTHVTRDTGRKEERQNKESLPRIQKEYSAQHRLT